MAWIYLAESEDLQSRSVNGCDQLPIAKSTPIVKECYSHEWPMDFFPQLLYGTISQRLQQKIVLPPQYKSYSEVFHARTSALQELEKAWQASEADYFSRSLGCVARLSQDLSFWRTYQPLLHEGDQKWPDKLPRWGMTVDGVLYPLHPLEHYTKEIGGSYWPTPQARAQTDTPSERKRHIPCLETAVKIFPNPTARDWKGKTNDKRNTPTLPDAVEMFPTPDANARGARKNQNGHHYTLQDALGTGKLNPKWVEWLMGYPIGWTDLEPWAMQWFQLKRKKRSKS